MFCFWWDLFCALKRQTDKQIAPNAATIIRANVVASPVSASLVESFIPRKSTVLKKGSGVIGALVAVERRLSYYNIITVFVFCKCEKIRHF